MHQRSRMAWPVRLGGLLAAYCLLPTASYLIAGGPPMSEVVQGNNRFALELHSRLARQPGNLFYSPASLSMALAMTFAGARGETAAEMAKVLHFPADPDRLHEQFAALRKGLNDAGGGEGLASPQPGEPALGAGRLSLPCRFPGAHAGFVRGRAGPGRLRARGRAGQESDQHVGRGEDRGEDRRPDPQGRARRADPVGADERHLFQGRLVDAVRQGRHPGRRVSTSTAARPDRAPDAQERRLRLPTRRRIEGPGAALRQGGPVHGRDPARRTRRPSGAGGEADRGGPRPLARRAPQRRCRCSCRGSS